jgi:hypothetical protein
VRCSTRCRAARLWADAGALRLQPGAARPVRGFFKAIETDGSVAIFAATATRLWWYGWDGRADIRAPPFGSRVVECPLMTRLRTVILIAVFAVPITIGVVWTVAIPRQCPANMRDAGNGVCISKQNPSFRVRWPSWDGTCKEGEKISITTGMCLCGSGALPSSRLDGCSPCKFEIAAVCRLP